MPSTRRPLPTQAAFGDLGTPLREVTFVIVDLETTGGAPAEAGITEIGAVKVCGGEVLAEFQTLVNPGTAIPPFVAALTGITDAVVAGAPRLDAVLPAFLEFLGTGVLVAHNAPYDTGFLKAACGLHGQRWPAPAVVDTARLARVALLPGEVPNCKLGTLARHVRSTTDPTHRALDDARATTDVLHALLERAAGFGVTTLEDLHGFVSRVSRAQRAKRTLADGLPDSPGVYVFQDAQGAPLYVGTSRRIRTRVRSYFTAAEQRRRMAEMIGIAERVVPIPCATALEARVRELRLIAEQRPRYNRQSRRPETQTWLKLTVEAAPRLAIVRSVADDTEQGARYLGPFGSRGAAEQVREALLLAHPLRTCTPRLAAHPRSDTPGCVRAELGRCLAPCTASGDRTAYGALVDQMRATMSGQLAEATAVIERRMLELAGEERYEEAAQWRERLRGLADASVRTHRLAVLATEPELVAAQPTAEHGWEIHLIRHGRLAAAATCPPGVDPRPAVGTLLAAGEHVPPGCAPAPAGLTEEARELLRWLEGDGVRLVRSTTGLALPRECGGALLARLDEARQREQSSIATTSTGRWHRALRPLGPVDARPVTRMLSA